MSLHVRPDAPTEPRAIPDEQELQALLGTIAADVAGSVPDFMLGLLPALRAAGYEIVRGRSWAGLQEEPVGPPDPDRPIHIRDET